MSLKKAQQTANNVAIRHEDAIARAVLDEYQAALREIRGELSLLYERYGVNGKLTLAEMTRYNRLTNMDKQITEILGPHARAVNATVGKLAGAQYEESFYRAAWSYDNELRLSLGWGQIPVDQVRAAVANPMTELALRELPMHTMNRIKRAVNQGIIQGLSMPNMMREVRGAMETTAADAMRIVRTEAHRARELGHMRAAEEAVDKGVDLWRVWDAALDDRTRGSHAALDGARARVGENFPGGPIAPGQWGIAAEDINCRCHATDVIEGYEPAARRVRYTDAERAAAQEEENRRAAQEGRKPGRVSPSQVMPYQTFREWAQTRGITGSRYGQQYNFVRS